MRDTQLEYTIYYKVSMRLQTFILLALHALSPNSETKVYTSTSTIIRTRLLSNAA